MLSLYTPTGANPAGLTCMELTLESLEALACKNVGLGPRERASFETSGSRVWMHIAVKVQGFCLISDLTRWVIPGRLIRTTFGGVWGQKFISLAIRLLRVLYSKASCLHLDSTGQSWYKSREMGDHKGNGSAFSQI